MLKAMTAAEAVLANLIYASNVYLWKRNAAIKSVVVQDMAALRHFDIAKARAIFKTAMANVAYIVWQRD